MNKGLYIFFVFIASLCMSVIACGNEDDEEDIPNLVEDNNKGKDVGNSNNTSTEDNGDIDDEDSGATENDDSDEIVDTDNNSDDDTGQVETPNFYNGKHFKYEWVKTANNHLCSYNIYFLDNKTVKVTSVGADVLITEKIGTYKIVDNEIVFTVGKVVISPWRVKLLSAKYVENQLYVESKDERIYDYTLKTSHRYFKYSGTITPNE